MAQDKRNIVILRAADPEPVTFPLWAQFLLGTTEGEYRCSVRTPPVPTLSAVASQGASLLWSPKLFLDLEAKGLQRWLTGS